MGLDETPPDRARASTGFYPLAVGDRIDGVLTVLGHLAVGRSSHLYQVWDEREWAVFACKVLAPAARGERGAAASLRREERVLRRCSHPNLVRAFRGGDDGGVPYLLMEYLEGPSLLDALEARASRRMRLKDAVQAALQAGAALAHLHRAGWLHLDVKPANVLLRDGLPVLVDLDCARRADGPRPARSPGTPPYMAPEQAAREILTAASDVYGLGALLYELLTGRWPHQDALEREAAGGPPRDPGAEPPPLARFRKQVPRELERAVARSLAPDAADRFPDVPSFLSALAAFG